MKISITRPASEMKIWIYTVEYRRIMETQCGSADVKEVTVTIPSARLKHLSSGIYYVIVAGKSTDKEMAVSKPVELIIMK